MKLVAMTTRLCGTSRSPEKTGWKNVPLQSKASGALSHKVPKGESVLAVSPRNRPFKDSTFDRKQWSYTEDNHPAQAWQHLEQHRDRAPRGPETPPPQGRCSSSIFRAETRTTRKTKRENTPPRRSEKIGYHRTPYCGQQTKGHRTVITSPDHNLQQAEG